MGRSRCYPSDTFDDEWVLIEALLPPPACETPTGGRPEKHSRREIVDAIRWAAITIMTRRLTRRSSRRNGPLAPRELVRD